MMWTLILLSICFLVVLLLVALACLWVGYVSGYAAGWSEGRE